MKTAFLFLSIVLLSAVSIHAIPYPDYYSEPDSIAKVEEAHRNGLIDYETALLYTK